MAPFTQTPQTPGKIKKLEPPILDLWCGLHGSTYWILPGVGVKEPSQICFVDPRRLFFRLRPSGGRSLWPRGANDRGETQRELQLGAGYDSKRLFVETKGVAIWCPDTYVNIYTSAMLRFKASTF